MGSGCIGRDHSLVQMCPSVFVLDDFGSVLVLLRLLQKHIHFELARLAAGTTVEHDSNYIITL